MPPRENSSTESYLTWIQAQSEARNGAKRIDEFLKLSGQTGGRVKLDQKQLQTIEDAREILKKFCAN